MKVTILGAAKSGFSAAVLAKKLGYQVLVSEKSIAEKFEKEIRVFQELGINYEFSANTGKVLDCDFAVTSPGIPPNSEVIQLLTKHNKKIISELEFAYQNLVNKNNIIAITGTNGKTTTTSLIHHIFTSAGFSAVLSGNIGTPLSDLVLDLNSEKNGLNHNTIIVTECSSYQLDRIEHFNPKIGLILNLTPDHLAYHGDINNYLEAKWKISSNMSKNNLLVLNADDLALLHKLNSIGEDRINFQVQSFSLNPNTQSGSQDLANNPILTKAYSEEGKIYVETIKNSIKLKEEIMNIANLSLPGVHNLYNSLAAILAAKAYQIRNEDIRDALQSFKPVEHRQEFVANINGISFINDSKATNVNSTWYALSSYKNPIIWIAGGRAENNPYSELKELVANNVKLIIAIGEQAQEIYNTFKDIVKVDFAENLDQVVLQALESGEPGDITLFSPSCKSFDMFANYENRGLLFKKTVFSFVNSTNNANK